MQTQQDVLVKTSGWLWLALVTEHQHRPGWRSANALCRNTQNAANCIKQSLQLFFFFYPFGRISWSCFPLKGSYNCVSVVRLKIFYSSQKTMAQTFFPVEKGGLFCKSTQRGSRSFHSVVCWLKKGGEKKITIYIWVLCWQRKMWSFWVHKALLVNKLGAKTNATTVNCGQFLRSKEKRLSWLLFDFKMLCDVVLADPDAAKALSK